MGEIKTKKCRFCGKEFTPYMRNGMAISKFCIDCRTKQEYEKAKIKKPSKVEIQSEKKKLDTKLCRVFSKFIRKSASDKDGYVSCYSCGARHHWKEVDAGHYISRAKLATKFDERNVKPQCRKCNRFLDGASPQFAVHLMKEYGDDIIKGLVEESGELTFNSEQWYRDQIKYYEDKLKEYD